MPITYHTTQAPLEDYWRLFTATGWNDEYCISAQELAAALRASRHVLGAFDGGRLVGFGRIVTDGVLHAMIYDLIVEPEYQGRGIGAELLALLVGKCREERIPDIQLFCARGKRGFYEKRGFKARDDDSPGMDYAGPR